jgi:hypothetical protein
VIQRAPDPEDEVKDTNGDHCGEGDSRTDVDIDVHRY